MDGVTNRERLKVQILRLLFKYNLVPNSLQEEEKFIRELVEILQI